ncbi:MAG: glycosyltransferase family 2 protein [Patescibacteria group bacterium]
MYKKLSVGVAVPAYNEEKLIEKTLSTMPAIVDCIVVINDCSTDNTLSIIKKLQKNDSRIHIINNKINQGIGYSLTHGLKKAADLGCDRVAVMAGDAQMDPKYLVPMLDSMEKRGLDFIKANRFMHFEALKTMPKHRRFGNIIVTILTKFATGYYSIFDTQNGYVIYTQDVIKRMPWHIIGSRYEFENTILIGLSIIDAKIGDIAIPALYDAETSTINLFSTTMRVLKCLFIGFWQRIYYKYVLYGFHPIALFLFTGLVLLAAGTFGGIWIIAERTIYSTSPTSGTIMLSVLPIILGVQLLLTALVMDVIEEKRS